MSAEKTHLVAAPHALPASELRARARDARVDILRMTHAAGSGHPGGSMSAIDLMVALFHTRLRVRPDEPAWPDRDRFILSKGHCSPAHYTILAQRGFFPREDLLGFRRIDQKLQGHSDIKVPGVDMSAGSLGMGLSFGIGAALAGRIDQRDYHVWVMLGDGELQEGQVWEAAMGAAHRGLDNLTAIVDVNGLQIDGRTDLVKELEPLADKWRSFGWHVVELDGHDFDAIEAAFDEALATRGRPTVLLARTTKGKGVSFMEDQAEYHGRCLTDDEMERAMEELGVTGWRA